MRFLMVMVAMSVFAMIPLVGMLMDSVMFAHCIKFYSDAKLARNFCDSIAIINRLELSFGEGEDLCGVRHDVVGKGGAEFRHRAETPGHSG